MLTLENIGLKFPTFSLKNVSLDIEDGTIQTLLGPSGSGKSCILKAIAGVYKVNSGKIMIDDERIDNLPPEDRNVGLVFQNETLFPFLNVYENIAFGLKIRKKANKKDIEKRVNEYAELLSISHLLNRKVDNLSGGEKQRVALSRSMILEPKILLLDEPFSALDTRIKDQLIVEFKKIFTLKNQTVLHVTHDQTEACIMAHKIAVIRNGVIEQNDSAYHIFNKPKNNFIADFVNTVNIFSGKVLENNDKKIFSYQSLEFHCNSITENGNGCFSFRPEYVQINREKPEVKENVFPGHITGIHSMGVLSKYIVDIKNLNITIIKLPALDNSNDYSIGENVFIHIPKKFVHQIVE
jgi:ABC-type Fe3+/spermidine/putrescine transport system ATPase subunit